MFIEAPPSLSLLVKKARKTSKSLGPSEAVEAWLEVIDIDPTHLEGNVQLGKIYFDIGDKARAEKFLRRSIGVKGDHLPSLLRLARLESADLEESIKRWKAVLDIEPDRQDAQLRLAKLYLEADNLLEAKELLEKALKLDDKNESALGLLANINLTLSKPRLAYDYLERLRVLRGDALDILEKLLRIADLTADANLISQSAKRLFSFDKSNTASRRTLARIKMEIGEYTEAAFYLLDGVEEESSDSPLKKDFNNLLSLVSKSDSAEPKLHELLGLYPTQSTTYETLAEQYVKNLRFDEAKKLVTAFLTASGKNSRTLLESAQIALSAKSPLLAEALLVEANLQDPDSKEIIESLCRLYLKFGYYGKAWRFLHLLGESEFTSSAKKILSKFELYCGLAPFESANWQSLEANYLAPERVVDALMEHPTEIYQAVKGRVVQVIHSLGPGGAERQLTYCLKALENDPRVESSHLLCATLSRSAKDQFFLPKLSGLKSQPVIIADAPDIELNLKKEVAELIELLTPSSRSQSVLNLARHFLNLKPEVVHAWLDESFLLTALAGVIAGVPKIVVRFGNLPPSQVPSLSEAETEKRRCYKSAFSALSGRVIFCANSKVTAEEYSQWLGGQEVKVFYNGLEALPTNETASKKIRSGLGIKEGTFVIGGVFHLTEKKLPLLWVEVAEAISKKSKKSCAFVVVGDGPMREEMREKIISLGLKDKFFLVGRKENVSDWYGAMDLLLVTSKAEGLANVVLEAQACRVPVVLPPVAGLPEAVEPGVTAILASGVQEASDASLAFINDEQFLSDAKARAKEFVLEKFSTETMKETLLSIYGL